jgi:hypothetical protein
MSDDAELFNDIVERDLFVELIADGVPEINAGYEVGWTPTQTKRNLADPMFREIVTAARDRADGTIEAALFKLAKNGNLGAMQMWLYNRKPADWKDVRRIEVRQDTTINLAVVHSTKQAVLEMLATHGPGALQPTYDPPAIEAPIIDAEVIDDGG